MVLLNGINQHIAAVLESIGWPDDAFTPIANDENRQILEHIEHQMEEKTMKTSHRDQLTERVKLLKDHYQNAEIGVTQNMVNAIMILFSNILNKNS